MLNYTRNDRVGAVSDTNPHTYEQVVRTGHHGVTNGHMGFQSDAGADYFRESDDNGQEFFRHWSRVTGVDVSERTRKRLSFSCGC